MSDISKDLALLTIGMSKGEKCKEFMCKNGKIIHEDRLLSNRTETDCFACNGTGTLPSILSKPIVDIWYKCDCHYPMSPHHKLSDCSSISKNPDLTGWDGIGKIKQYLEGQNLWQNFRIWYEEGGDIDELFVPNGDLAREVLKFLETLR